MTLRLWVSLYLAMSLSACGWEAIEDTNDLIVLNEGPCDLTIYVDGHETFTVPAGSDQALADIGYGRHVFEALNSKGEVVQRKAVELAPAEDFYLVVDQC